MRERFFTRSELALHSTHDDAWVAIFGKVFDITPVLQSNNGAPRVAAAALCA
jgi:cytochrome b involved in lipid metabolism